MNHPKRVYWLHALSAVHVGAGRGEGYIDLPLVREKVTTYPYIPGSAVKGVYSEACGATDERRKQSKTLAAAFGRAGDEASNAGALVFSDARLVCLPVRSLFGTLAWCTSRFVLQRLTRDLELAGHTSLPAVSPVGDRQQTALVPQDPSSCLMDGKHVYLDELDVPTTEDDRATAWAKLLADQFLTGDWARLFQERFVIVPDEVFNHFSLAGTEVQSHVRIDPDFKRVSPGALWYEESLPAEAVLAGLVWCDRIYAAPQKEDDKKTPDHKASESKTPMVEEVLSLLKDQPLQFGGKATVGKGRMQLTFKTGISSRQGD